MYDLRPKGPLFLIGISYDRTLGIVRADPRIALLPGSGSISYLIIGISKFCISKSKSSKSGAVG